MSDFQDLDVLYKHFCVTPGNINEHLPTHYRFTQECNSVVEIGVETMISTWAFLYGLKPGGKYIGIDLKYPPVEKFILAKLCAEKKGLDFNFFAKSDMLVSPEEIGNVDLIFIDSLHTYCHLTYELEKFSHLAQKYLSFHDSSFPWEYIDDDQYRGDYSEYPEWYDRTKRGVWPAIEDFLLRHHEWELIERHTNNNGFTVLKRVTLI